MYSKTLKYQFMLLLLICGVNLCLAQESTGLKIVAFGNSTTAPREGIQKVYSVRVHEQLLRKGLKNQMINSGIGGSHTGSVKDNDFKKIEHGMDRFQKAVLEHQPDWVIINFGLNDAYQDKGITGSSRIPLDKYEQNLSFFINELKKINSNIILLPPNPVGSRLEKFRFLKVQEYMKAVKRLARKNDVHYVDTWKLFYKHTRKLENGIDSLLPDGVHPNDEGHRLIADSITDLILKKSRSVSGS